MKISKIIEWLQTFDGEQELSIVISNPKERILHKVTQVGFCTDKPMIMITVDGTEPMDIIERDDENE